MGEFRLEASQFEGLTKWRWSLTAPGGALIADHKVRLDAGCWQFEAFTDLQRYLQWHTAPDKRIDDEARIVAEVGAWIGAQVFGPVGAALANARPATVEVVVPAEPLYARSLLLWPLELAHAQGGPLALQDVTLVMQIAEDAGSAMVGREAAGVETRLRVLGLFSLPMGSGALNLRREPDPWQPPVAASALGRESYEPPGDQPYPYGGLPARWRPESCAQAAMAMLRRSGTDSGSCRDWRRLRVRSSCCAAALSRHAKQPYERVFRVRGRRPRASIVAGS